MSGPVKIADLAKIVHARSSRWRAMALLKAFFDESGLNREDEICSVGGFVGSETDWSTLEASWDAQLKELGIDYFHMTECMSRYGQFAGKDEVICRYAEKQFARIIAAYNLQPVYCSIPWSYWDSMDEPGTDEFKKLYKKPFHLLFDYCARELIKWSHVNADDEPIAIVFSQTKEFQPTVADIHAGWQSSEFWGERLATLTFGDMRKIRPLQAADMIAYDVGKYWIAIETIRPFQWQFSELITKLEHKNALFSGGMYTSLALRNVVKLFNQIGRPIA